MPKINTYGDSITDLNRLLAAAHENAAQLPDVTVVTHELETVLDLAQDAKYRQDFHGSERQLATQDLRDALARGRDAAIQLRSAARLALGARNEKLVHFRVIPLRKRGTPKNLTLKPPVGVPPNSTSPAVTTDKP
jgi:hypothetical protein